MTWGFVATGKALRTLPALAALWSACALAAPDEELLGRAEGYPICQLTLRPAPRCLVGLVSRMDEVFHSRPVPRGPGVHPLRRESGEPAIGYRHQGAPAGIDDYLARNRTTGLLIMRGDTILVERYQYDRGPTHRMASYSMAKTVVAMLVGIALAEGAIRSLDDTAATYVKDLAGHPYGDTPLRHLLSMSSGVRFAETYSGADDVATLIRLSVLGDGIGGSATVLPFRDRVRQPGERFSYSSAETQVLGLVLRHATDTPLAEYFARKVWQPLGAEADASWLVDAGGHEVAYIGINATLRDYGRLGMLLANDGSLGGHPIVPAAWVRAMTTAPAPQFRPGATGMPLGYGYQTWILDEKRRQFVFRGFRGQAIYVDPAAKLVMVHTRAGDSDDSGMGETLALWNGVVASLARPP